MNFQWLRILIVNDVNDEWEVLTLLFSCKSLFIASNQITSIPTEIGELTNLKEFYFGKQSYDDFAMNYEGFDFQWQMSSFGFCDEVLTLLFSCKSLFIDANYIQSIPTEIGGLANLQLLKLCKWSCWLCNDLLWFWFSMTNEFSWFLWRGAHLAVLLQITFYSWK